MSDIISDFTPLIERAVRRDGTIGVKIISPGWGSSGYYSPEILQRDIPRAFPPGTHMFWNHDTPTEESERPEGDLSRLAAVTVGLPRWEEAGAEGPGMYTDARVFSGYAEAVDQIAEHIGVSIRGMGTQTTGEAEGKKGPLVGEITQGRSIDFVTAPGAGGAILQVFESAPDAVKLADPVELEEDDEDQEQDIMDEELKEAQDQLKEAVATVADLTAENAKLQERLLLQEAAVFVAGALAEADLPDLTQRRLAKQLIQPPVVDGAIDEAAYTVAIAVAVTEARAEIAAISGQTGQITGQGTTVQPAQSGPNIEEARKRQDAALAELGYGGKN
jgi:hypothetical protein